MGRRIVVQEATGDRTVALLTLGQLLVSADQALRSENPGSLNAAGKAHMVATQEAIKVASEFLALAARTSDTAGIMTTQQRSEVAAFYKELSLIEEMLFRMDTGDLRSHVEIMKQAIAQKTSEKMNGDQAFAAVLKTGRSQQEYLLKLAELTNCAR
jgi:hypothetical protein